MLESVAPYSKIICLGIICFVLMVVTADRVLPVLDVVLRKIRAALYWFACAAMMVMLLTISVQVITRYGFKYTPEWSEEVARYLFVYVVFLGSALIMGESGHLAVEFLPNRYKGTPFGAMLRLLRLVCGYLFVAILFTQGYKMAEVMTFQTSPGLDIPMSYIYAAIPLSAVLMLLYMIRDTLWFCTGREALDAEKKTKN
jgi:TRAP-type C4-dicarboxylate transport system permease small subunit